MTIQEKVNEIAESSPYGWGHSIDFGSFVMPGLLGEHYLKVVKLLDSFGWLPSDLSNLRVADVGCFSGGITKVLSERNARIVYAIDEIPSHLEQCRLVVDAFDLANVQLIESSLYRLPDHIEKESLDLILCSGVLYHCSDMLVALLTLRDLLKPNGTLLIETNAVNDDEHSYSNFGNFFAGMWWQPTSGCISDMLSFTGFDKPIINFFAPDRCLAKTTKNNNSIPFKRGLNYPFDNILDEQPRTMDERVMRPA